MERGRWQSERGQNVTTEAGRGNECNLNLLKTRLELVFSFNCTLL